MTTYLTVAAHPDDEILGCGATMARLASQGHDIHIVILGEGATARFGDRADGKAETAGLCAQAKAAAEDVGARSAEFEDLPDNRFDAIPLLDIVKRVEHHIERVKPAVVFTHHASDLNVDHRLTCQAVLTATRPMPGTTVDEVLSFEIASSSEWAFGATGQRFSPNVFFDVSESIDAKLTAIGRYEGELREYPHPRSLRALRAIAERWGSNAGVPAAEAFEAVRLIRR